jgi:hypothetical protein
MAGIREKRNNGNSATTFMRWRAMAEFNFKYNLFIYRY